MPSRTTKRTVVADALRETGLRVDGKNNVLEGDLMLGSLTPDGDLVYPPHLEYLPTIKIARQIIRGLGCSTANYWDWKPNS